MTEQSEHLSNAQIENYGNRSSGAGPESAQRGEHQRIADQHFDDPRLQDQTVVDRHFDGPSLDDKSLDDQRLDGQSLHGKSLDDQSLDDQRVEAHLADCPSCRKRLLDFHRTHFALLVGPADPQLRTASTPECPSVDDLRQLAAGLFPETVASKLAQHAATCDHCGPLLRTFTEDFSDDFTPEEQAALAKLQSSTAAWQKNTARQMLEAGGASAVSAAEIGGSAMSKTVKSDKKPSAGRQISPVPDRKPFFWKWALVPATAAIAAGTVIICGVVGFGIWYARRDTPEKVEKLQAQVYTDQRKLEMRYPGAKYADFRQTRSGESESRLNTPAALSRAAEQISGHLQKEPDNPKWLMLSARLDLLDWGYKAAL
ncbi:MAG TPA: hypothetical protein VN872_09500, partial [Candidatus Acidoferrum sp.]|nr:hypothetical protein [Candidatus Acidoferrum sp.]